MLNVLNNSPLYQQLYQDMLGRILNGDWPEDFKIPTEAELCNEYNVSRMTIRLAMDKLKDQGYLIRKQGRGTFVTRPVAEQELNRFYSFSDDNDDIPMISEVLSIEIIPAPEKIAAKLAVETGLPVVVIERIRSKDGIPIAYEKSYVVATMCPGITKEMIETDGLYKTIMKLGHVIPSVATETFEAILINEKKAKYLNTKAKEPGMFICRVARTGDTVIEYCESVVRGNKMKYHITMQK